MPVFGGVENSRWNFDDSSSRHCDTSGGWHQDQHAFGESSQQVFPQQQTGFDRLAEPHFVGQQHSPAKPPQDLADRFDLVRQMFDARQPLQAEQLVVAAQQVKLPVLQMQTQPDRIVRKSLRRSRQIMKHDGNAIRGAKLSVLSRSHRGREPGGILLRRRHHDSIPSLT